MRRRKKIAAVLALSLAAGLISSAVTAMVLARRYSRVLYGTLGGVCNGVLEREPSCAAVLAAALKSFGAGEAIHRPQRDFLSELGYGPSDFVLPTATDSVLPAVVCLGAGVLLFGALFFYRNKREQMRLLALTDYLEQAGRGKAAVLSAVGEDRFSHLEDEIYKTVTSLYQTRDAAIRAKTAFADSLSNIAHQIKTPITAISLSLQTTKNQEQIKKQLLRLTRLEEALLVLARLDAGTLVLHQEEADVFTVLTLAADNLQELLAEYGVRVEIPEEGQMAVNADLEWTMEAVMNLMKNCMEHNRGGTIHCSYDQNPLYTRIRIRDEGRGFDREDIPHLFERFYRGKNAAEGGVGLGLALSKEIIERQNGTIRAENPPEGGACFEIRFYRH